MGWQQNIDKPSKIQKQLFVAPDAEEQSIVDALNGQEMYIDLLWSQVKMRVGQIIVRFACPRV